MVGEKCGFSFGIFNIWGIKNPVSWYKYLDSR